MPFEPKIVPKSQPTGARKVLERLKAAAPKVDGEFVCNRCGGRTSVTVEVGKSRIAGRIKRGTVIVKDHCAECWKRGIYAPMEREIKPVK